MQAPEQDRVHGEEITRQQALRLGAQEPPPGSIQAVRGGPLAAGAKDTPDSRRADLVAKAGQFAYHCTPHPWMKGTVKVTP